MLIHILVKDIQGHVALSGALDLIGHLGKRTVPVANIIGESSDGGLPEDVVSRAITRGAHLESSFTAKDRPTVAARRGDVRDQANCIVPGRCPEELALILKAVS